jgi:molybdate transport system substrate-binding protein
MAKLMLRRLGLLALALAAGAAAAAGLAAGQRERVHPTLTVAAAASLSVVAADLTRQFHDATGIDVRSNFAGSNTLARQIVEGATPDVFISADAAQMDFVEQSGRLVAGSRVDVLSNQLVIVVSPGAGTASWPDHLAAAAVRRVAMGDTEAVPAGVYGRQWLETIRLWGSVESKVVRLPSSPAVLVTVREGRAQAGIVYATDARAQTFVQVAHLVPEADAPRIVYPAAAILDGHEPEARRFLEFLRGAAARRIFEAAGFRVLPR